MKIKVNNLPANYTSYNWIVMTVVNDELWYYGAWRTSHDNAFEQALEVGGVVSPSSMVEPA